MAAKIARNNKGFTLIELSIVLVVVGIMLYAGLSIGSIQIEAAKMKQTKDKLDKIQKAIQLYYETNNRLPCPAKGALALSSTSFGLGTVTGDDLPETSMATATCTNVDSSITVGDDKIYMGVVPTRTLDLPDDFMTDAWDDRIAYAVTKRCVDKDNWSDTQRYKCTTGTDTNADTYYEEAGNINMKDTSSGADRSTKAVYVLVSYGKDTYGAFPDVGGSRINTAVNTSSYQDKNAKLSSGGVDAYTDAIFYDGPVADYDGVVNYFDDLVRWKTGPQIGYEKEN